MTTADDKGEDFLAKYEADPIDTTNPAAICDRLGQIEDELAFVSNELARAAYWVKKYKGTIDLQMKVVAYPQTSGTIPERESQALAILVNSPEQFPEKLVRADAAHAHYKQQFEGLDSRRSILQSCLKMHTREQDPQFGNGSHHR